MVQQCGPGAVEWIERILGDCVYNARDMAGFAAGMASICCWLVAQMPQLYRNYRTQSAEALSPWFLAEWLLGDTFNLLGALLKGDQLPTVVFTAQYFICVDAVMMYMYYISLQRRRERLAAARRHRHHRHHHHHGSGHRRHSLRHSGGDDAEEQQPSSSGDREGRGSRGAGDPVAVVVSGGGLGAEIRPTSTAAAAAAAAAAAEAAAAGGEASSSARPAAAGGSLRGQRLLAGMGALLLVAHLPGSPWQLATQPARRRLLEAATGGVRLFKHMPHWAYSAGTVLGYCSSALYLTSRVSQIAKNAARGSAEGLAISMFLCAIAANSFYGASILIRSYTWAELRSSLPWLIGSLGTVALDLAIFAQACALGRGGRGRGEPKHHPSDEDEPLLPPEGGA